MNVPFHRPDVTEAEAQAAYDVVMGRWLTSGPVVARLEDMAKELTGARNVVAVNSCATALWMAMRYAGEATRKRDVWHGVSIPVIGGHFAANGAMLDGGLEIVPMDCNEGLSCGWRTGPIQVLLDYGGCPIPFSQEGPPITEPMHGFYSIVDAAYTLGAPGDAKPRGWVRCYSLQATKGVTSGEGGLLATEDDDFAAWCREVRTHGMQKSSYERGAQDYDVVVPGGGFLLPDVLGAIAVCQLSRAQGMRAHRVEIAKAYDAALAPAIASGRVIPVPRDYDRDALGLYAARIPNRITDEDTPRNRDLFRMALSVRGVETRAHYGLISDYAAYRFLDEQVRRDCPNAARIASEVVTLPFSSAHTDEEIEYVCQCLSETLS